MWLIYKVGIGVFPQTFLTELPPQSAWIGSSLFLSFWLRRKDSLKKWVSRWWRNKYRCQEERWIRVACFVAPSAAWWILIFKTITHEPRMWVCLLTMVIDDGSWPASGQWRREMSTAKKTKENKLTDRFVNRSTRKLGHVLNYCVLRWTMNCNFNSRVPCLLFLLWHSRQGTRALLLCALRRNVFHGCASRQGRERINCKCINHRLQDLDKLQAAPTTAGALDGWRVWPALQLHPMRAGDWFTLGPPHSFCLCSVCVSCSWSKVKGQGNLGTFLCLLK